MEEYSESFHDEEEVVPSFSVSLAFFDLGIINLNLIFKSKYLVVYTHAHTHAHKNLPWFVYILFKIKKRKNRKFIYC